MEFHEGGSDLMQGVFFGGMWILLLLATLMVRTEWAGFHGALLIGVGFLMMICRPSARVPRVWWGLALCFAIAGSLSFLPATWFFYPAWRTNLEHLGLPTGSRVVIQARQAAEQYAVFVITVFVGLWMAGFRASGFQLRLWSLAFTVGVAFYAVASKVMLDREVVGPLVGDEHYGFFPNRNQTATYLVMGSICGLGGVLQAARDRRVFLLLLHLVPTSVCLWALVGLSVSRAGPLLLVAACVGWLLLVGLRYLGGNGIKLLGLMAIAAAGLFLVTPSKVKERIFAAVTPAESLVNGRQPSKVANPSHDDGMAWFRGLDFRIPTALDTLTMIGDFKWTGIGPGQFVYVFPQYRHWASVDNDSFNKHPENDWLWLAAETGIPATLALVGLTVLAATMGCKSVRTGKHRALRGACLVAALVVPFHGLMDVPGHKITLALTSCWLFAMALGRGDGPSEPRYGWAFKLTSLTVIVAGVTFLQGGWWGTGRPATEASTNALEAMEKSYWADVKPRHKAYENKVAYQPPPGGDPIIESISRAERELAVAPLEWRLIRHQALMAGNFKSRLKLVERDFAWDLALQPSQVAPPWWQAQVWSNLDPLRCNPLVEEALRRADRLDGIQQGTRWSREATLAKMREAFRYKPDLQKWILLPPS